MGCHPKPIDELIFFRGVGIPPTSNHFSRILTNNYTNIDPVADYFWGLGLLSMPILYREKGISTAGTMFGFPIMLEPFSHTCFQGDLLYRMMITLLI